MSELIGFRTEFLPHVTRLFYPGEERITGKINWFRYQMESSGQDLSKTCVLLKGPSKLLAFCWLCPLESRQPGLVQAHIAVDPALAAGDWQVFWAGVRQLAGNLAPRTRLRVILPANLTLADNLTDEGLAKVADLTQFCAQLETHQETPLSGDFRVVTLAGAPSMADDWLRLFNSGISAFWHQPVWTGEILKARLRAGSPEAWRLGMAGNEPVAALFYEVIDGEQGLVRINAAATPPAYRNKGYGRLMIKDVLAHLRSKGFKQVYQLADGQNQATALLYKMQGFAPQGFYHVLEGDLQVNIVQAPVAAAQEETEPSSPENQAETKKKNVGFYPSFHSQISGKRGRE
jgi:GNAT superfamily N-acetyltransferase